MTVQIALDKNTHDIIKTENGIARVSEGRFTVQTVKCNLLVRLGEWRPDPTQGWVNFDDFKKNYDLYDLEIRATSIITKTVGVKRVTSMKLNIVGRKLFINFTANTEYGVINMTVPWGN